MDDYIMEINMLKRKYADKINIYVGLEIDYLNEWHNAAIPYFKNLPLDYRIGSVHFLTLKYPMLEKNMMCIDGSPDKFKECVQKYFDGDVRKVVRYYFKSLSEMIDLGHIDIVGHLDKIYMNAQNCEGFSMQESWYVEPLIKILYKIAEKNLMIEINTKNLKSKNQLYPHEDFLYIVKKFNIPVMVNSDCHYPDKVNDGRNEAFDILKKHGFEATRELIDGTWTDVPLL
jgi:histidinol-phosphatase (PHP family)